jgi:uncharacterized coiled-coil protein SlyX
MSISSQVSALTDLRRDVAETARQLSELDLMLADYHAERLRLIRDLRRLQARLRDLEEQRQDIQPPVPKP